MSRNSPNFTFRHGVLIGDWTIYRGDVSDTMDIAIHDTDPFEPIDLDEWGAACQIRAFEDSPDIIDTVAVYLWIDGGQLFATLAVGPDQAVDELDGTMLDVQLTRPDGLPKTLAKITLRIEKDVTR